MAEKRSSAGSSAINPILDQISQFNAGVIDNTLGLLDLGAQGVAGISNMITGRNDRPVMLGQRAKSALNVESDPSSPSYIAGSVAPAVATGVGAMAKQGLTSLRNVFGGSTAELGGYFGGEAGAQLGRDYGGDYGELVGGLVGGTVVPNAPRSDIFAGPSSRTADQEALFRANQMERQGASPEEIKQATGFQKNLDGEYMYWLPTNESNFNYEAARSLAGETEPEELYFNLQARAEPKMVKLEDIYDDPNVYAAYPDLKNINVALRNSESEYAGRASYDRANDEIMLNMGAVAMLPEDAAKYARFNPDMENMLGADSSLMHEIQHAISSREGRSRGGSPEKARSSLDTARITEQRPYREDATVNLYANMDLANINKINEMRDFERFADTASADQIDASEFFQLNSRGIEARLPKPELEDFDGDIESFQRESSEWARNARDYAVEQYIKNNSSSALFRNLVNASDEEIAAVTAKNADELNRTNDAARISKEIEDRYERLGQEYNPNQLYMLMNDEYLARTAQRFRDDARSSRDFPLYRDIEGADVNTDDLWNNPSFAREADTAASALRGLDMNQGARMQRAQDLEFDTSRVAYRGLRGEYDPNKAGNYQMFTSSPEDAGEYGSNVVSSYLRKGNNLVVDGGRNNFNSIPVTNLPDAVRANLHPSVGSVARTDDIAYAAQAAGYDSVSINNVFDKASNEIPLKPPPASNAPMSQEMMDLLDEVDASGMLNNIPDVALPPEIPRNYDPTTIDIIFDPKNIRSIEAEFDPTKADSADLLSSRQSERQMSALRGIA